MLCSVLLFSVICGIIQAYPDAKAVAEMTSNPVVTTPLGTIQGSILKSRLGKNIFAFRGLRFAKPPTGELRFQPPVPVEKWNGTYDGSRDGAACPQDIPEPTSEDCLFLNVYSTSLPKGEKTPKRPVIVYFHYGGFLSGSGQSVIVGPQYIMDKEIVLVVPQYRLASLGFISTGDKNAPGNNGLKDQVEALRWVKQNIESFGGDPDMVTIAGYSAGSAAVSLHLVSPMSRGLFHRAIAMSGSAIGNWPIEKHQLSLAQKQAQLLKCPDTVNPAEIIKCLKTKKAEDFAKSVPSFREFGSDPKVVWLPVIEGDFGQERFLTENPAETFSKGQQAQVPLLTGITADEFAKSAFEIIANTTLQQEINVHFEKVAPICFIYDRGERSKEISTGLVEYYFGTKAIDNTTLSALVQIYSDGIIGFGVHKLAHLSASSNVNPVYYYKFAYKGQYSFFYLPGSNNTAYGAVHGDDLIYLFHSSKLSFPLFKEADPESKIVEHLTTMWTNFALTGNPTPETPEIWKRFTLDSKQYLIIDENLTMGENLYAERYAEWEKVFP